VDVDVTPREDDPSMTALESDPDVIEAIEEADAEASAEVMHLLEEGVPLALIADLVDPEGPESPAILAAEGLPADSWWLHTEPVAEPDDVAADEPTDGDT